MEYKTCSKCNLSLPMTHEDFYRSSKSKDGYYHSCKKCDDAIRKYRYQNKLSHNVHKKCKHCQKYYKAELCRVNQGIAIFCSLSCRKKFNIGSNSSNSKLKEKDVYIIKISLLNDESAKSIADTFNVNLGTINAIKYGRTWKHVMPHACLLKNKGNEYEE